jgi:FKBP-type peptidyl-prolyl cis-trans isomerase
MPQGSKYTLWIPSELAYGAQPPTQSIKPNSTLEFEVELLEVIKAK